jgi:hypothetical protein
MFRLFLGVCRLHFGGTVGGKNKFVPVVLFPSLVDRGSSGR